MKQKTLLVFLALIFTSSGLLSAQHAATDSLRLFLNTAKNDSVKVDSLNRIGRGFIDNYDYEKGLKYVNEALNLSRQLNYKRGEANSLNHLGISNIRQKKYTEALECYEKSLKIRRKIGDIKNSAYSLNNIAIVYQKQDNYPKSLEYYLQCLKTMKEIQDSSWIAESSRNIGGIYVDMGNYAKALEYDLQSLKIYESIGYKEAKTWSLNDIGTVYLNQGNYLNAEECYNQSLKVNKEISDSSGIALSLNNIGTLYNAEGNYYEAVKYYQRALKILEEIDVKSPDNENLIAELLANTGIIYFNQGIYQKALEYYSKGLKIQMEIGDSNGVALCYRDIGNMYSRQGKYDIAFQYLNKGLLLEEKFGAQTDIANLHNNVGYVFMGMGNYPKALLNFSAGLKIYDTVGDNHDIAESYCNLGEMNNAQGNFEKAVEYFQKSLDIYEKKLGIKEDPDYVFTLNNISKSYCELGQFERALSYSQQSFRSSRSILLTNMNALSENQKSDLINTVSNNSDDFFSNAYFLKSVVDSSFQWLYDYELFQRGLVLESSSGLAAYVQKDSSLKELWFKFRGYKNIVGKEYLNPATERIKNLPALEDSANEAEKELLDKSAQYRNWKGRANATWQDVKKNLAPNEAAVEFISFDLKRKENTDSIIYAAMVLTRSMQYPKLLFLFEEKQLTKLFQNVSAGNSEGISGIYTAMRGVKVPSSSTNRLQYGDSLYKLIWQPLMPYLKNINSISFVPDGLLNKINAAAVPTPDGKRLCEKFQLKQLLSTRSIAFPSAEPLQQPAAFFGGIDYNYTVPKDTAPRKDNTSFSFMELTSRSSRGGEFGFLIGAKQEVEDLSNLYKAKSFSYQLIEGKEATEETFKQMEGKSPAVLHIATHGFFFPSPDKESNYSLAEDPLLRSGLALAGCNYAWKNNKNPPHEDEDGILTAYEIARLNLSTTNLVVLSACETGLGDIKGSEGVYGLQRAFKMAGVDYVMMSLWAVPDKETQEFMESFYTKWLGGQPIRSAFRQTQNEMAAKYDPYKWAAFVLVE